eukprot:SAG22_NODE_213_length_15041_cov_3.683732_11_plen_35_part_00
MKEIEIDELAMTGSPWGGRGSPTAAAAPQRKFVD